MILSEKLDVASLSKRGASCFLVMLSGGLSQTSFAQTFNAPLKFYRRNCGQFVQAQRGVLFPTP